MARVDDCSMAYNCCQRFGRVQWCQKVTRTRVIECPVWHGFERVSYLFALPVPRVAAHLCHGQGAELYCPNIANTLCFGAWHCP